MIKQHTTLFLVRHGETVGNAAQILQGQTQGELNAAGFAQAEEVAARLAAEPIAAFYASDLHRAIQTCRIIARPHAAEVLTTELLRERDWGSLTGRFIPDLQQIAFPDDVETLEAIFQRARSFLDLVCAKHAGQTVVAVGHGIINKAIQSVFYNKPMKEVARMGNAEVRILSL